MLLKLLRRLLKSITLGMTGFDSVNLCRLRLDPGSFRFPLSTEANYSCQNQHHGERSREHLCRSFCKVFSGLRLSSIHFEHVSPLILAGWVKRH